MQIAGGLQMDVCIFGGSGLIGQSLAAAVEKSGHHAWVMSRSSGPVEYGTVHTYSLGTLRKDIESLPVTGPYAIVNLAGESISGGRWTENRRRSIRQSRIELTRALSGAIASLDRVPEVFVSGSAIGYYGSSETATFVEDSAPGTGFLPEVTMDWEQAAENAAKQTRVVLLRTGVVLSPHGGALPPMVTPYRLFAGGRVGSGRQWVSWIHIADVVGIIQFCIANRQISGPVNATAPNPVRMDEFGRLIAAVLHRPHWFPVPAVMMRLLFGSMSEIILEGQRVLPEVVQHSGYEFQFQDPQVALADLLRGV